MVALLQDWLKPIKANRVGAHFGSGWVEVEVNFMVGAETGTMTVVAVVVVVVVVDAVTVVVAADVGAVGCGVALEWVGSASHWTWEARAANALGDAIAGVMVVVMMTHLLSVRMCVCESDVVSGWIGMRSPLTTTRDRHRERERERERER
jgi:hypothetical protein